MRGGLTTIGLTLRYVALMGLMAWRHRGGRRCCPGCRCDEQM